MLTGRGVAERYGTLARTDLTVEVVVLSDAVLQVGDLGLEPRPSGGHLSTLVGVAPGGAFITAKKNV